jgi:lipid II:glycine glycyltransferase (peptidoglycan interpeptide bridge formation enzyme)
VEHCRRRRTLRITWNFRDDGRDVVRAVAQQLGSGSCRIQESNTHVLDLAGSPAEILSSPAVAPVTRRQVRQATERGVSVRPIDAPTSLAAYDTIYRVWAARQEVAPFPAGLVPGLMAALGPQLRMLGAWHGDALLAAILLFCEPREWFYWHGVRDRERDRAFAMDALLARAIEEAATAGASRLNFGASAGIASIEHFKERWGARRRAVFCLRWDHPRWSRMLSGWRWLRRSGAGA